MLFAAALSLATGFIFGLFPALHSDAPDLVAALQGTGGAAVGRARGGAVPDVAGHGADRAVDGAARRRGSVREESGATSAAWTSAIKIDNVVTFAHLAGAERLRRRRDRRRSSSELEEELAAIPGVTGVTAVARCRCSPATTGAATSYVQGFKRGPDTDANARYNEVGAGLLPHARASR